MPDDKPGATRREFAKAGAAAAVGFMIVPRHVLGHGQIPPSDRVNIAVVGFGGMGAANTQAVLSQNIVAICDVDDGLVKARIDGWKRSLKPPQPVPPRPPQPARPAPPTLNWTAFGASALQKEADARWQPNAPRADLERFLTTQLPRVRQYRDYRQMFERQRDIDAVIISTPDHMHAPIGSAAMAAGKHVYIQKPLCWSVYEARHLAKQAAANPRLVTQMGNQGHSSDDARRAQDYLAAGVIGEIREVHAWTNRPLGYWPQGVPRPEKFDGKWDRLGWGNRGIMERLAHVFTQKVRTRVPRGLDWDLFLGAAPHVDYHPIYHPSTGAAGSTGARARWATWART